MTTFVLVPGAGGAASDWHRLVPELRRLGHEAIAVSLPAGDEEAGLEAYADVIVAAAAGRPEVVLVAHSMGGLSAPLTCDRLPVRQVVLLNAMIPVPGETGGDWWAATGQREARRAFDVQEGRDPDAEFDDLVYFYHDVPQQVVADVTAGPDPEQAGRPFAEPWPLAAWPDVPTRVLVARDDRVFPPEFQTRLAQERLGITPEIVPGGHMCALSFPAELAANLDRGLGLTAEE